MGRAESRRDEHENQTMEPDDGSLIFICDPRELREDSRRQAASMVTGS